MGKAVHDLYGQKVNRRHSKNRGFRQMYLPKNEQYRLVCLAATMWGFDGIVLTPRLFNLYVPFVVFILHLLPLILMSIIFGKEEIKNIKKL